MVTDANTKLAYSKAQARAREMGGADKVTQVAPNKYTVLSSKGDTFYTVTVVELAHQHIYLCTCKAGQSSRCCWHKAACLAFRTRAAVRAAMSPAPALGERLAKGRAAGERPTVVWAKGRAAEELWGNRPMSPVAAEEWL